MASRGRAAAVAAATALMALAGAGVAAGRDRAPEPATEPAVEEAAPDRTTGGADRDPTPARADGDPTTVRAAQARAKQPLARLLPSPDWREVVKAGRPARPAAHHPVDGAADYGSVDAVFGAQRSGHVHEGQDVFAPAGTPLVAVRDGEVLEAGSDAGRGNHVSIYSREAGETYVYFHMLEPAAVEVGERVRGGAKLGSVGCTGSCFGDHLHFQVHEGRGAEAPAIDPLPLLRRWE